MLKNSARNWTLKLSEIFGTLVSLITEKSISTNPGPMTVLRPRFPNRLKHVRGEAPAGIGIVVVSHPSGAVALKNAAFGATALMKHAGLMYCKLPCRPEDGFVSEQPGTLSGMAIGSELFCPIR